MACKHLSVTIYGGGWTECNHCKSSIAFERAPFEDHKIYKVCGHPRLTSSAKAGGDFVTVCAACGKPISEQDLRALFRHEPAVITNGELSDLIRAGNEMASPGNSRLSWSDLHTNWDSALISLRHRPDLGAEESK